jgi:hypothetical protein
MSDDRSTVEICQILAGMVPGAAWQGVMIAIGYMRYLILTPRGRVGAAKIVSSIAGAFYYIYGKVEGATSVLYGFFTDAWGAAKNVGTPIMTTIMQIFGPMAHDEAFKAYNQTKNITNNDNTHTVDVEYEKVQRELIKQIANEAEKKYAGSGDWIYFILSSIPGAFKIYKFFTTKKNQTQTNTPQTAPVNKEVAVTPTKRTRARNKSPARKAKSK